MGVTDSRGRYRSVWQRPSGRTNFKKYWQGLASLLFGQYLYTTKKPVSNPIKNKSVGCIKPQLSGVLNCPQGTKPSVELLRRQFTLKLVEAFFPNRHLIHGATCNFVGGASLARMPGVIHRSTLTDSPLFLVDIYSQNQ
jgi:hypothetical protein